MSVGGAGLSGGTVARGSPADLLAVIKDDAAYQQRLEDIKAKHADLDAKIAMAGAAADVVRLQREAAALQVEAQGHRDAAKADRDAAASELASARTIAADTVAHAVRAATTKANDEAAKIRGDAQAQAAKLVADAKAEAAETKREYDEKVERLKAAIGYP